MSFRRDFDAEAVEIANGRRPHRVDHSTGTTSPPPPLFTPKTIVVAQDAKAWEVVRDFVEQRPQRFRAVGGDWHIRTTTETELRLLVEALQGRGLHGIVRSPRGFLGG